jgi:hypothetical protein
MLRGAVAYWWVDRTLPGIVVALVSAPVALFIQHRALSRKIHDVTRAQTAELRKHLPSAEGGDEP